MVVSVLPAPGPRGSVPSPPQPRQLWHGAKYPFVLCEFFIHRLLVLWVFFPPIYSNLIGKKSFQEPLLNTVISEVKVQ